MSHVYRRHPTRGADLLDFSPWDCARWSINKMMCDRIADFFTGTDSDLHQKVHRKLKRCCDRVSFYRDHQEPEGGRHPYKLLYANFCHQRICLLCQGRLANIWRKRLNRGILKVEAMYPGHRWVFLTLTVKNVPLSELNGAIVHLHDSWSRMSLYGRYPRIKKPRYKPFPAVGWVKSIEVTYGTGGTAHPHIHALLFLPPGYFKPGNKYDWTHADWTAAWRRSLRADYDPMVWLTPVNEDKSGLSKVGEIAKYITKPSDLSADAGWTREYALQIYGCQLRGIGGVAFAGNPDLAAPRDGEDLVGKRNAFAQTDERASFRWNVQREGYDLYS